MDPELQAWARKAFRPAKMHGRLPARSFVRTLGEVTQGPKTEVMGVRFYLGHAVLFGGIVGASFLIGRWWARRHAHESFIGGLELLGCAD